MSTHGLICVKRLDGNVYASYLHFDADKMLPLLKKHYNSQEMAEQLSECGDASYLDEQLACRMGQHHSFDNPIKGVCVFYGRDRKKDDSDAEKFPDLGLAMHYTHHDYEYVYYWDQNKWSKINKRKM